MNSEQLFMKLQKYYDEEDDKKVALVKAVVKRHADEFLDCKAISPRSIGEFLDAEDIFLRNDKFKERGMFYSLDNMLFHNQFSPEFIRLHWQDIIHQTNEYQPIIAALDTEVILSNTDEFLWIGFERLYKSFIQKNVTEEQKMKLCKGYFGGYGDDAISRICGYLEFLTSQGFDNSKIKELVDTFKDRGRAAEFVITGADFWEKYGVVYEDYIDSFIRDCREYHNFDAEYVKDFVSKNKFYCFYSVSAFKKAAEIVPINELLEKISITEIRQLYSIDDFFDFVESCNGDFSILERKFANDESLKTLKGSFDLEITAALLRHGCKSPVSFKDFYHTAKKRRCLNRFSDLIRT